MTMSVNGTSTNGISFTTSFAPDPTGTALSPEGLLLYCSSRLQTLDTNIKQYFAQQQTRNGVIGEATKLMEIINHWPTGQKGSKEIVCSPADCQNHANQGNELLDLFRKTNSPEVKRACAEAFQQVTGMSINDFATGNVTPDQIRSAASAERIQPVNLQERTAQIEGIKNTVSNLTKAGEMDMIQLQSLVSQRQLAVQLTTQLLQSLNETSKQVVGNIR